MMDYTPLTDAEKTEVEILLRERECRCQPPGDFSAYAALSTGRVVILPPPSGMGWLDESYRFPCPVHRG